MENSGGNQIFGSALFCASHSHIQHVKSPGHQGRDSSNNPASSACQFRKQQLLRHSRGKDQRETHDDYHLVVMSHGRYRIIECRNDIQWILQKRMSRKTSSQRAWQSIGYCRTKKELVRRCKLLETKLATNLHNLPDRYEGGECDA